MFFGFKHRPPGEIPSHIKVKREIKRVCSKDKKCRGSMHSIRKNGVFEFSEKEVFFYEDGSHDFGIDMHKCTIEHKGMTLAWYEDIE